MEKLNKNDVIGMPYINVAIKFNENYDLNEYNNPLVTPRRTSKGFTLLDGEIYNGFAFASLMYNEEATKVDVIYMLFDKKSKMWIFTTISENNVDFELLQIDKCSFKSRNRNMSVKEKMEFLENLENSELVYF